MKTEEFYLMNSTPMPETKILTGGKGGGGSCFVSTLLFKWIETPNPDAKLLGPSGRASGKICHLSNDVMARLIVRSLSVLRLHLEYYG